VDAVVGTGRAVIGLEDDFDGQPRNGMIDLGADQITQGIAPPNNIRIMN
jgi:hypothetical protein